jgi:putative ABC transport system permease protein
MPDWKPEILRRLIPLKLAPPRETEIAEELAQHLEDRYQEFLATGRSRDAAFRSALDELKEEDFLARSLHRVEKNFYREPDASGKESGNFVAGALQDIRYALRMLRKSPGFAAVAILTLALGIGANTAIFSVVNAVVLQPLPFPHSDQLVDITEQTSQGPDSASYLNFLDWQRDAHSFSSMGAYTEDDLTLTGRGEPTIIPAAVVSSGFFSTLDAAPLLGRTLEPQDDVKGAPRVAVIGEGLWRERFATDPHIVGKSIKLNDELFTVAGVLPSSFNFPDQLPRTELWIPVRQSDDFGQWVDIRQAGFLSVMGRTEPGVTISEAQAELNIILQALGKQYTLPPDRSVSVISLKQSILGDARLALLILLGAVGLVVLIACANIANLLLARATGRAKEIAVRVALGAGRARLFRQLLTESVLLGLFAGLAGLALAFGGVAGIKAFASEQLPHLRSIGVDGWVLAFTLGLSILAGVLFGFAPAWQSSEVDVSEALKEGGRGSTGGAKRRRIRSVLVAAEVAIAVVLLVGAGLLLKSFYLLVQTSPGFDPRHLLKADVLLPQAQYTKPPEWSAFFRQAVERMKAIPGVEGAAAAIPLPFTGSHVGWGFTRADQPEPAHLHTPDASAHWVTPSYFRVMHTPLLRGREFEESDSIANAPKVVIINKSLAQRYFPNEDPVGKSLRIYGPADGTKPIERIVGIVGDEKDKALSELAEPMLYFPYGQTPWWTMSLVLRTRGDPAAVAGALRRQIYEMDSALPVDDLESMTSAISDTEGDARFRSILLGFFGALALVLAAVGIYSMLAYVVVQRTHEIGIRVALGAQRRDVLRLVIGQGMQSVLTGVAIGIAAAFALSRVLATFLYGISDKDPLTFVGVCVLLTFIALAACSIPARRAMRVDPIVALRYE